jgi:multiple sugar transport system substrate-binding protein
MNGKASMGILGHWFFQDFAAVKGLNFDIAPIPMGPDAPGHSATALGGIGLAISAKTKYPEQCWRFVKYWTGLQGQQGFAASGLWVPTLRSIGQSAQYKAANSSAPHATLYTDVLAKGYVHSLPITQAWGQLSTPWANTLIDQVWSGKQSAAAALPALNTTINADLKKYG